MAGKGDVTPRDVPRKIGVQPAQSPGQVGAGGPSRGLGVLREGWGSFASTEPYGPSP